DIANFEAFTSGLSGYVLIIVFNSILPASSWPLRISPIPDLNSSLSRPILASSIATLFLVFPPPHAPNIEASATVKKKKLIILINFTFETSYEGPGLRPLSEPGPFVHSFVSKRLHGDPSQFSQASWLPNITWRSTTISRVPSGNKQKPSGSCDF